jgi:uncharacterized damage-inducible protein DinB
MADPQPEVWLRGPVEGVPAPLQPVAHALLQSREDVEGLMQDFPDDLLWQRPAGVASVGFHLQHLSGVVDRLFTYARDESLSPEQRRALAAETSPPDPSVRTRDLVDAFVRQIDRALDQLRSAEEQALGEPRFVGRKRLPSTYLGLLFHAAEHTQRHVGQLLVTSRVLREGIAGP